MEDITYKLDQYEGPLDLLLSLIAKNKVSIIDIPISDICDQYMEYIEEARKMDLEIASEFISMASQLMLIKSRMLLPKSDEDEEDPRTELIDALLLYQKATEAAEELRPLYATYSGRMIKDEDEIPPEKGFPLGLDPALLSKALSTTLNRLRLSEQSPTKFISPLIKNKVVNVEEKIEEVVEKLNLQGQASLFFLLKDADSKAELVAIFMGILELIKLRRVLICQAKPDEEYADKPLGFDEEYEQEDWMTIKFEINSDYTPENNDESEQKSDDTE